MCIPLCVYLFAFLVYLCMYIWSVYLCMHIWYIYAYMVYLRMYGMVYLCMCMAGMGCQSWARLEIKFYYRKLSGTLISAQYYLYVDQLLLLYERKGKKPFPDQITWGRGWFPIPLRLSSPSAIRSSSSVAYTSTHKFCLSKSEKLVTDRDPHQTIKFSRSGLIQLNSIFAFSLPLFSFSSSQFLDSESGTLPFEGAGVFLTPQVIFVPII